MLIGQVGEPETGYPMAHNGPHIETVVMCDPATPSPIVRRGYRQKIKRRGGWLANDSAILSYGCTSPTTKSWVEMRVVLVEPAFFSKIELRRDGCHHKHAVVGRRTVRPRPAVDPGPDCEDAWKSLELKLCLDARECMANAVSRIHREEEASAAFAASCFLGEGTRRELRGRSHSPSPTFLDPSWGDSSRQ